ncbi:MAG: NfeD family protein [Prevotella nanceiensis]|nr:NfeD family protein [Hoylesella nanceiensis]
MYDFLNNNLWLFWLFIGLVCLITEMTLGTFFVFCLAIGAFLAIIFSLLSCPFWFQIVAFAVLSVVSIFFVRPVMIRFLHKEHNERLSNVDALIGRVGVVIEDIKGELNGYVKIDGDEWRAVSCDNSDILNGERVRVVKMDGLVVTVERVG